MSKSRARKFADLLDSSGGIKASALGNAASTPTDISDQDNNATGYFDLPAGTTAQRPAQPNVGMIRYNLNSGKPEVYDSEGWTAIAAPPSISSVSPETFNGDSGTEFTIRGGNFSGVPGVKFITALGVEHDASAVTRISSTELRATTPVAFTVADEPLKVRVTNATNLFAQSNGVIDCGGVPTWATSDGQISSPEEGDPVSIQLSASDSDGANVTYELVGSLPSGLSLNTQTGVISGTAPAVSGDTNNQFSVRASDGVNTTQRTFSILVREFVFDGTEESRAVTSTSQLIALNQPNGFYYVNDGRQTRRYYVDCDGTISGEAGYMRLDNSWATYYNGGACINGGGEIYSDGRMLANTDNGGGGSSQHGGCGVTTNTPFRATAIRLVETNMTSNGNWGGVNFPNAQFKILNADSGSLAGNYYGGTYPGWGPGGWDGTNIIEENMPGNGKRNLGGDYFIHAHLGVGSYQGGANRPCEIKLWFNF
jgi:hypothetical protein